MIYGLDCNSEYCKNDIMKLLQELTILYSKGDHEEICKILNINCSVTDSDIPVYRYNKEGMIYIPDNPCIEVRIHLDEDTRLFLDTLLMVTNEIINEKNLVDLIIERWIVNILLVTEQLNIERYGKEKYIRVNTSQESWYDFVTVCKKKGIPVRNGLKMAIFDFLRV